MMGLAIMQFNEKCSRRGELDAQGIEDLFFLCSINSKANAKFSARIADAREAAAVHRRPSLVVEGLPAVGRLANQKLVDGVERLADRHGVGPRTRTVFGSAHARCIEVVDELLALRETRLEQRSGYDTIPEA